MAVYDTSVPGIVQKANADMILMFRWLHTNKSHFYHILTIDPSESDSLDPYIKKIDWLISGPIKKNSLHFTFIFIVGTDF